MTDGPIELVHKGASIYTGWDTKIQNLLFGLFWLTKFQISALFIPEHWSRFPEFALIKTSQTNGSRFWYPALCCWIQRLCFISYSDSQNIQPERKMSGIDPNVVQREPGHNQPDFVPVRERGCNPIFGLCQSYEGGVQSATQTVTQTRI